MRDRNDSVKDVVDFSRHQNFLRNARLREQLVELLARHDLELGRVVPVPGERVEDWADLATEAARIFNAAGLTRDEWERKPWLVPPGNGTLAAALLAHVHAVVGGFPTIVVVAEDLSVEHTPTYNVFGSVNLSGLRSRVAAEQGSGDGLPPGMSR